jgi:Domain of unknown function (DUF4282)
MTDQSSSRGGPDERSRGGHVPGEQYTGEEYYGVSWSAGPGQEESGSGGYGRGQGGAGSGYGSAGQGGAGAARPSPGMPGSAPTGPGAAGPGLPTTPIRQAAPGQAADARGFLSALFDFSFTSFVTTRIIKFLYILILVMVSLSALIFTFAMFRVSALTGFLTLVIGDPLFIIIVMAFWRLVLESFVVRFRIAEDVRAMRERAGR